MSIQEGTSGSGGEKHRWEEDPRLTAYALGEATDAARAEIDAALASGDESCRAALKALQGFVPELESMFSAGVEPAVDDPVLGEVARATVLAAAAEPVARPSGRGRVIGMAAGLAAAAAAVVAFVGSTSNEEDPVRDPKLQGQVEELAARSRILGFSAGASTTPENNTSWYSAFDAKREGRTTVKKIQPSVDALAGLGYGGGYGGRDNAAERFQYEGTTDAYWRSFSVGGIGYSDAARFEIPNVVVSHNDVVLVAEDPKSTFAVDVDTASYTRTRGSIRSGRTPHPSGVRVEEFINYFDYGYVSPPAGAEHPFLVSSEVSSAPWAPDNRLVRIGIQGERVDASERPAANLVFLIDVSGSMDSPHKLPLVTKALGVLTESLRPDDRIAMVVYASSEGVVLDSTPATARETILQALESLQAGGSTNGGAGIQRAYSIARDHLVRGGINRVILCTDGDFNVGISSDEALEELIAKEAADGVDLTVLGFGGGNANFRDEKMERLSNRGNGNFAYIDSELEARRVLAAQVGSTLQTIARDVKVQVEWDPSVVESFRLIGYENRVLAHEDFENDAVDAGEIGAGHSVTALYELTLHPGVSGTNDLGLVKFRYRRAEGEETYAFDSSITDSGAGFGAASDAHRFSAAVASFGMQLRQSPFAGDADFAKVRTWSLEAMSDDASGMREEFVRLIEKADAIK